MTPRTRLRAVVLTFAVMSLLGASCAAAEQPAATVHGTEISIARLGREVDLYAFLAELNQAPCGSAEEGESEDAACARFTLSNLVQQELVESYAKANDIIVEDADITGIIKDLDNGLGKEKVDEQLKSHHLTREDLTELARRVLLFQAVEQAVARDRLSDEELRKLYEEQLLCFTTIQVDHILVKTEAEARRVYDTVTAPAATEQDFLDLAKEVSIDPTVDQNSGSLGSTVAGTYVTAFAAAAVALEPGQISQPVKTEFGWHVIRMVDKEVTPFDGAKDKLITDNSVSVFNDWLRDQADGTIDINPRYGRWDAATLQVARISSTATDGGSASPSPSS